jgi:hypothetical protein
MSSNHTTAVAAPVTHDDGAKASGEAAIVEVRTYRARAGQRERLMSLMRELAFPIQRTLGMRVLGPFPSIEDQVSFVWLRGFPPGADRDSLKRAFYEGREWTERLEEKLMPLLEGYSAVAVEDHALRHRWPADA